MQKMARNKMFGKLKSVDWTSKVTITNNGEKQIASSENTPRSFNYLTGINKFNVLIQKFQRKTEEDYDGEFVNDDKLGKKKFNKLIVITTRNLIHYHEIFFKSWLLKNVMCTNFDD